MHQRYGHGRFAEIGGMIRQVEIFHIAAGIIQQDAGDAYRANPVVPVHAEVVFRIARTAKLVKMHYFFPRGKGGAS